MLDPKQVCWSITTTYRYFHSYKIINGNLLKFENYCGTLTSSDCYCKNNHSQTSISQLLPIPIVSSNEINVFFKGLNYSVKFDDPLVTNSVALWWTAKIKWFVSHNITIECWRRTGQHNNVHRALKSAKQNKKIKNSWNHFSILDFPILE